MKKTTNDLPVYAPMQSDETMDPIGHRIQAYAQTQGDKVALIDERGSVTWRELLQQVNRIANRLRDAGLETGDCVAGLSENTREYLSLYLGTLVAGGCMVPKSHTKYGMAD